MARGRSPRAAASCLPTGGRVIWSPLLLVGYYISSVILHTKASCATCRCSASTAVPGWSPSKTCGSGRACPRCWPTSSRRGRRRRHQGWSPASGASLRVVGSGRCVVGRGHVSLSNTKSSYTWQFKRSRCEAQPFPISSLAARGRPRTLHIDGLDLGISAGHMNIKYACRVAPPNTRGLYYHNTNWLKHDTM